MSQTLRSPRHEALRSLIELFAREHSVVSWVLPFVVYQTRHRLAFFGSKFQFVFLDGRHQRFVPLIALVVGVAGASRQPNPQARYFPQLVLVQQSYRLVVDAEDRLLWRWLLCGATGCTARCLSIPKTSGAVPSAATSVQNAPIKIKGSGSLSSRAQMVEPGQSRKLAAPTSPASRQNRPSQSQKVFKSPSAHT